MRNCFITLGRFGDILNAVPLVHQDYLEGNKPMLVVSKPYAEIGESLSYCDVVEFPGDYSKPFEAARLMEATKWFDNILIPQCYGTKHDFQCSSFAEEAWRLVGKHHLWGKLPLVIDRRNQAREDELLLRVGNRNKPMILVATHGLSSPFRYKDELLNILKPFKDKYDFIDLSGFRAERFCDLLALYERAFCLISVDTGTLHLAQACPNLSVIALVTHSPTPWHGAPQRPNHVLRIRYNEFPARIGEIANLLSNPIRFSQPKLVHVWNDYNRGGDNQRRFLNAQRSWLREYERAGWQPCPISDREFDRNSYTLCGDPRAVPLVTDLINKASELCELNDLIVLTNDDTVFVTGISERILEEGKEGPFWGSRYEHKKITHDITPASIRVGAYKHCGADIFVFRKSWWLEHRNKIPDMILSFEAWDLVLRMLIDETGGRSVDGLVAHEIHNPFWHDAKNRECAANLFNRNAARKFFSTRGGWPKI